MGLRVVFAGTPEFARVALDQVLAAGFQVPLVMTQPDRPAGRGMKLQASPVKQVALAQGIALAQPRSLRLDGRYPEDAQAAREALLQAAPDVMVVAAYGLILPQWVLDLPRLGCLNIHASLLPRWRGAAPIHRAIEAGDTLTGVTIMQMDAGLDTGAMVCHEAVPIAAHDTTPSLHDQLAALGGRLIVQVLRQAVVAPLKAEPQPDDGVTYAHKIEKSESTVDWRVPASVLACRLRAFDPFPAASTCCAGEVIKLFGPQVLTLTTAASPGTVLAAGADGVDVACGDGGVLRICELQRAGGKRLPVADFLRGFVLAPGTVLG